VPDPYRWTMLAGVWLLYCCFGLVAASTAPLVEPILTDLGLSHSAMGSVMGAWPLVYIASAIPCGALVDRLGLRWSLFLAALIIAASAALRGLALGHASLFAAVAIFGLGGPLISIGAPTLISQWFAGKERGLAMGIYITGPSLGGIAALALTNSLAMPLLGHDWRAVMMAYAAVVGLAAIVWFCVASHPANRAAERRSAAEPRRSQLEVFAVLIRLRPVRLVLMMSVGIFFFNHGLNNWLPEILRDKGMDAATAGFWAAIPTVIGVAGALVIPRLAAPNRRRAIMLALFVAAGVAALLIQATMGPGLVAGLAIQGITRSSMMAVAVLVLMEIKEVGSRNTGLAGGMFFSAAEIGGVLGPLTIGYLYDATGGFAAALYLMALISAGLVLVGLRLGRLDHP
jgi:cyanate permease